MRETRKPRALLITPSLKKQSEQLAKKYDLSFNDVVAASLSVLANKCEYAKECAEREGLTPEEAEIKFLKEWGLL